MSAYARKKSVFTIHNYGDQEDFTPLDERNLDRLEINKMGKVIIRAACRRPFLQQLLNLGVDSSLVYPGIQGIGQRIAEAAIVGVSTS